MFKLVVLAMLVCAASAGIIGAGLGHGVAVGHVAVAHAASSYQNNNQISLHPTPVVAHVAAPVAVAHAAPVVVGIGHGGLGLGGLGLGHGILH